MKRDYRNALSVVKYRGFTIRTYLNSNNNTLAGFLMKGYDVVAESQTSNVSKSFRMYEKKIIENLKHVADELLG